MAEYAGELTSMDDAAQAIVAALQQIAIELHQLNQTLKRIQSATDKTSRTA